MLKLNNSSILEQTLTICSYNPDKFEIDSIIKEGGFGSVYKMKYMKENSFKYYAMKILEVKPNLSEVEIQNEIEILEFIKSKKQKPKSLSIYIGYIKRKINNLIKYEIYMEYKELTLSDFLKNNNNKPLDKFIVQSIFEQLIVSLCFLQINGYSHRDLKPENILIELKDDKPFIYLVDFGVSKKIEQKEINEKTKNLSDSTIIGTKSYFSPEMFIALVTNENKAKVNTIKSDIFSLGIIIIEMATQSKFYKSEYINIKNREEYEIYFEKRKKCLINKLKRRYEEFNPIIESMLEMQQSQRPNFVDLFLDVIDKKNTKLISQMIFIYNNEDIDELLVIEPFVKNKEFENNNQTLKDFKKEVDLKKEIEDHLNKIVDQSLVIENFGQKEKKYKEIIALKNNQIEELKKEVENLKERKHQKDPNYNFN